MQMREPALEEVNIPEAELGGGTQGQTHVCPNLQTAYS